MARSVATSIIKNSDLGDVLLLGGVVVAGWAAFKTARVIGNAVDAVADTAAAAGETVSQSIDTVGRGQLAHAQAQQALAAALAAKSTQFFSVFSRRLWYEENY